METPNCNFTYLLIFSLNCDINNLRLHASKIYLQTILCKINSHLKGKQGTANINLKYGMLTKYRTHFLLLTNNTLRNSHTFLFLILKIWVQITFNQISTSYSFTNILLPP